MTHYFENDNHVISKERKINAIINNEKYIFITDNNVFAKKGLDFGTRTLLESIDVNSLKGNILDFGCGYGPIGIYLAHHGLTIDMVDVNFRALNLTKKNAKINGVKVNAFESDIYQNIDTQYDYIITNPPIRVGNEILYKILFGAYDYLVNGGHLIFVIHKDQGGKTIAKKMTEKYRVTILNKNKGFLVIDCEKQLTI